MDANTQTANSVTDEERKKIYSQLADITLDALEKGLIPYENKADLSDLVLSRMDALKTRSELILFLEELTKIYPVYGNFLADVKNAEVKVEDTNQINNIVDEIKHMEE